MSEPHNAFRLSRGEKIGLAAVLIGLIIFGGILERRTALRQVPRTDLGVYTAAAAAIRDGENLYAATDWHGWHYQYPPTLAILIRPLAFSMTAQTDLPPGTVRTTANTPWGYSIDNATSSYHGLTAENRGFFVIVLIWYIASVASAIFAAHLFACVLEENRWNSPPPVESAARRRWWKWRALPLLICITSIGTDYSRGQVDVFMLFAVALALYLLGRGRAVAAGICLSIPVVIKLFPPFILLLPLWRRDWRLPVGCVLGLVVALIVIPVAVLGPDRTMATYKNWVEVLAKPALGKGQDASRASELTNINATDNQSLLAFIHNWTNRSQARDLRPPQASDTSRQAVYWIGGIIFLGFVFASGLRRQLTPHRLLIITGILLGMTLVICPIVHNFYYLLIMPLVLGLVAEITDGNARKQCGAKIFLALGFFMLVDVLARAAVIGPWLRDMGVPLISLMGLMATGLALLRRDESVPVGSAASV